VSADIDKPSFKPAFLKALEGDSGMFQSIYHVDPQQTLDAALLMLTHFAANVPRSENGGILEIARNFVLVSARPKIPEWFGHRTGFLTEARAISRSETPTWRTALSDVEIRGIRQHVRHLARFGMMFAEEAAMLREHLADDRKRVAGRFMLGPEDGPLMPKTGMLSHVALVLDGPGHLRILRGACRWSRSAILHLFGAHAGRFLRPSLVGWCDLATVTAAMHADQDHGMPVDWRTCIRSKLPAAPALPGRPLLLPAPPDGPWGGLDLGLMPHVCLCQGLSRAFNELVRARFLHERFPVKPDDDICRKLREAHAAENAQIAAFPARFRIWAEPVAGLSRALVVLFLMLGGRRDGPAETGALADLALDAAARIRGRSLKWLRHVVAAEMTPGLLDFDRALYDKLLVRGPQGTRELCRAFHRLTRQQLDDAVARLQDAALVEQSDGQVGVRAGATAPP